MTEQGATDDADKASEDKAGSSPAAERAKRFREAIDTIRSRAEVSAKATAALGTAGLTGIAIGKFADVFPARLTWPSAAAGIVAVVGFIALGLAAAWFTARLWKIDAPVSPPTTDDEVRTALEGDDALIDATIRRYGQTAARNGAPSLLAFEARGQRLERIANRLAASDERRPALLERAKAIREEVDAAKAETAADIVRSRAKAVVTGTGTVAATIAFVVGLAGVAVGSDYLEGERSGKVSIAKECAAAGKALEDQALSDRDLPPICSDLEEGGEVAAGEQAIARANACAAAVKALTEAKLDTTKLTAQSGPCPAAAEPEEPAATPEDVASAALGDLLARAKECEEAGAASDKSTAACGPIYDLIERARNQQ